MKRVMLNSTLVLCTMAVAMVLGGSLTPPPGPVAGTMKTLTQVEPRIDVNSLPGSGTAMHIITGPGSYYLSDNINVQSGKVGVLFAPTVTCTIATLDLSGFTIWGATGSSHGVQAQSGVDHYLCVRNGAITTCGGNGIDVGANGTVTLADLTIADNNGDGIHTNTASHVNARNLAVSGNAGDGVDCAGPARIGESVVKDNAGDGVRCAGDYLSWELDVAGNGGDGVEIGGKATLRDVTFDSNTGPAINILASASGVVIESATLWSPLSPNTPSVLDAGTGSVFRNMSINVNGANTTSAVVLGSGAMVHGLSLHVTGGTFSGPVVDGSAGSLFIDRDEDWYVSGASASSFLSAGGGSDTSTVNIVAKDCSFTTSLVNIVGDGVSFGGNVSALGTTSGPTLLRVGGNGCHVGIGMGKGMYEWLRPAAGTPVGIDVVGTTSTIADVVIKGISTGGTAVRINAGAAGTELHNLSVAGSGVALLDQGTRTVVDHMTIDMEGANAAALVTLGAAATANDMLVKGHNCTLSNAMVLLNGDGAMISGLSIAGTGSTTAQAALRISANHSIVSPRDPCSGQIIMPAGIPIGIDIASGASNSICGATVKSISSGGTGIRIQAGANGNQIDGCRFSGIGAGQITAVSIAGNNNLAIGNRINALGGGAAFSVTGVNNVVGNIANAGNIATLKDPACNFVH